MGFDTLAITHGVGIVLFPAGDGAAPVAPADRVHRGKELLQGGFQVGADRHRHGLVLVQLGPVNVDMENPHPFGKFLHIAGNPVIKAYPQGQYQVGLMDGPVGVPGAVHAEHVQAQGMPRRKRANPHDGGGHGTIQSLGEAAQFIFGARRGDTSPDVQKRTFALADEVHTLLELVFGHARYRHFRCFDYRRNPRRGVVAVGIPRVVLLDILGNIDQYRTGTVTRGEGEGFANHFGYPGDSIHQIAALGNRLADGDNIHFLEGVLAQQL